MQKVIESEKSSIDIDKMFGIENENEPCFTGNIEIDDAVDVLQGVDTGEVPEDYDIGF